MKKKIFSVKEMQDIIKKEKMTGKTIISTSGCFDIIHQGHIQYLREARAKGDLLIIFLNSDKSVRNLKGADRPIIDEAGRSKVLSEFESVDYICLFDDETPCRLITQLKPDIFIKGGDYRGKQIPEMEAVKQYGGRVEYVSVTAGCSTTNIAEKIKLMGENYEKVL